MTRKNKNKLNKLELGIILILSISLFLCLKQTYYKKVVGQIIYCQGNSLMVQQKGENNDCVYTVIVKDPQNYSEGDVCTLRIKKGEWQKYDKIISIKPLK